MKSRYSEESVADGTMSLSFPAAITMAEFTTNAELGINVRVVIAWLDRG